ncbi:MAG: pH regulation protein F [Dehalococcoidia bacterium]|jgi:multicomponent Na+:H+ antiporter subunit F|nr:pH regulation protein F [Dehalococcoidales bacterium]NQT04437.1 pH regulation protein F [Dehalococcoidia bacterium]
MNSFLLGITIFIVVLTAIALYRVAVGKTIFDRIIAAGLVGTNGFIILILIGFLFERVNMFIDIAIAYALLNFVIVIVLGKYFDRGGERL